MSDVRATDVAEPSTRLAPEELIGYRLRRVQGAFVDSWRAYFGALGVSVTPVQGGVVMLIEQHPGLTQSELARRLQIEAPTLHESIRRLADSGLVERLNLEHDRRAQALVLTPSGRELATLIKARIEEQEAAALAPLSATERRQLADLLGRVLAERGAT